MADIFLKQKVRHLIELETEIQKELSAITIRYNRLLNGYLEGLINPKTYEVSHKEISEKKMILEARRNEVKYTKADEFTKKIREMFELAQNLSETYKQGDHGRKLHILQKLEFELFVNNKKELTIEESKLLKALEILNYTLGNATEN